MQCVDIEKYIKTDVTAEARKGIARNEKELQDIKAPKRDIAGEDAQRKKIEIILEELRHAYSNKKQFTKIKFGVDAANIETYIRDLNKELEEAINQLRDTTEKYYRGRKLALDNALDLEQKITELAEFIQFAKQYPVIDVSFIGKYTITCTKHVPTWNGPTEKTIMLPRIGIFSLKYPLLVGSIDNNKNRFDNFKFMGNENRSEGVDVPQIFKGLLREATVGARYDFEMTCQAKLPGIIPPEQRQLIIDAQKDFGENIFLIAELSKEDWEITTKPKPADPLIVGLRTWNTVHGDCMRREELPHLIGQFNTTVLEHYITSEFTKPR